MTKKQRTKVLNQLINQHGLQRIARAGLMSPDSVRQCASDGAERVISEARFELIQYRLADQTVWQ
jgi:hypothetical protein